MEAEEAAGRSHHNKIKESVIQKSDSNIVFIKREWVS